MRTSNPFKVFLAFIISLFVENLNAQTIHIIPNPPGLLACDSARFNYPIIFNNKLYIDGESFVSIPYLHIYETPVEYDGNTFTEINVSDRPLSIAMPVILNNKLCYQIADSFYYDFGGHLSAWDGSNAALIPNSTLFVPSFWAVYKNKLYYYSGSAGAVYDGNIAEPSNLTSSNGVFSVYNDKLIYTDSGFINTFDGSVSTTFPNPDTGACEDFETYPDPFIWYRIIYNNKLYFAYNDSATVKLAQFDGSTVSLVSNSDGYRGYGIVSNNILYFQLTNSSSPNSQLAKYDGNTVTVIPNPDSTGSYDLQVFNNRMVSYNNNLYLIYKRASGINQLVKYDGNILTVISNPDAGKGFDGSLFVYDSLLYSSYTDSNGVDELISYDGSNFKFIPTTDGSSINFSHAIVFNSTLYFSTGDHLAYLDEGALATTLLNFSAQLQNNNAVLTWKTARQINSNYFNIQRSFDGVHFTTINKLPAAGNNSTKSYTIHRC